MLGLAIIVYSVRLLLYSILPAALWVLPVQLLHGLSFGIYLMASVTLAHQVVGAELVATAQALLGSAFGLGTITGALIGGALLDRIGITSSFRLAGGVALFAFVVFMVGASRFGDTQSSADSPSRA